MLREAPDILITTPESLYLMLTGRAQKLFEGTRWCIIDEIHAVASTKRGAHLALTLERLSAAAGPRRAADRPVGHPEPARGGRPVHGRPAPALPDRRHRRAQGARPADPRAGRVDGGAGCGVGGDRVAIDPLEGGEATRRSIWPAIYPELLELIRAHKSTILFVNNRRAAERLAIRLNDLAGEELARSHHGSLAREERTVVEEMLKAGELPCLVATSSLELGIDMGAVDLVIQVESPKSVARGLQRIGRAGHSVGDVSRGRIFPKFRADLLECAVVAQRMREAADRDDGRAAQRRWTCSPSRSWPSRPPPIHRRREFEKRTRTRRRRRRRRRPVRARHPDPLVRRAAADAARERARHARRPLPVIGVRRAAPADRLGPRRRDASGRARARASWRSPTPARSRTAGCSR